MKILIVSEDLPSRQPGGAALHALLLANTLLRLGHRVEVLGRVPKDGQPVPRHGFEGTLHATVDLSGTGWKELAAGVFMPMRRPHIGRRFAQAIAALGVDWDVIHYHGHFVEVGAAMPAGTNFVHTLHDQGSDCMINVRFRDGAKCPSRQSSDCAGCATPRPNALQRLVSTATVDFHRRTSVRVFQKHKAIFVSEFLRDALQRQTGAFDTGNTFIIHNFIDFDRLASFPSAAAEPGRLNVVAVSRIDLPKGVPAFVNSISSRLGPGAHVRILGDGPALNDLKARFESPSLRFEGWTAYPDVIAAIKASDLVVVPSIWDEPCATSILEAISLGKQVYALRGGGSAELTVYASRDQLCLFDTMDELTDAVLSRATPRSWPMNSLADVHARVPEILSVYRLRTATVQNPISELTAS